MATRALLCPECGATVTAGRLSCLECGALLAAVAGVGRRAMQTVAAPQSSTPAAPVPLMAVPQVPVPQVPVTQVPMAQVPVRQVPVRQVPVPQVATSEQGRSALPLDDDDLPIASTVAGRRPAAARSGVGRRPTDAAKADAVLEMPPAVTPDSPPVLRDAAGPWPAAGVPLPASATFPPGSLFAAAGAEAGSGEVALAGSAASEPGSQPHPRPGSVSLLADLPLDAPNDLAGWLVAVGAVVAGLSVLLPWAAPQHTLIGATTLDLSASYFDSWGLAAPWSFVLVLITGALLVLALWPNRVPRWIRGGVLPVLVGGLLLGIDWVYSSASAAFGGGIGLVLLLVGAAVMALGGAVELRPRRHGPSEPGV